MLGWEVIPRVGFGDFTVSPHGLGIALGYFVGTMLLARRARARGFNEDHAWNAAAISVVGAILGARIAYVAGHFSDFDSPLEWLQIYKGGISLVGGLLGGFLAAYLYCRSKGVSFLQLTDLGAPGIAIGTAVGRTGDLIIGDHLGKETSGFWGWTYKGGELISPPACIYDTVDGCIEQGMTVHQTATYDMFWSLIIFVILMRLDRKPRFMGFLTLTWASLYALGRIATDFTRVDKTWLGLGLTGSQITSVVVLSLCLFLLLKKRGQAPATVPRAPVPVPVPAKAASPKPKPAEESAQSSGNPASDTTSRQTKTIVLEEEAPPQDEPALEESVFKAAREQRAKSNKGGRETLSASTSSTPKPKPKRPLVSERNAPKTGGTPKAAGTPKPSEDELLEDEFDWEP